MQCTTEVSNILLPPRGHRMLQFHFYSQDVDGWTNVGARQYEANDPIPDPDFLDA